jgi:cytidylate kinase
LTSHPDSPPTSHGQNIAPVIAIDGPVASGKTAVGLNLARELGYRLVDTGMIYRAIAWLAIERGLDVDDEPGVVALAHDARFELGQPATDGGPTISVNGRDITAALRRPDVDRSVSHVSRMPGVRQAVLDLQRRLANEGQIIMLGRDIGTVVLPDAPLKIYLDATAEVRAHRRYVELKSAGTERPEAEILAELHQRDEMDSSRHVSPLRPAADAIVINTDELNLDEVIARVREAALSPP